MDYSFSFYMNIAIENRVAACFWQVQLHFCVCKSKDSSLLTYLARFVCQPTSFWCVVVSTKVHACKSSEQHLVGCWLLTFENWVCHVWFSRWTHGIIRLRMITCEGPSDYPNYFVLILSPKSSEIGHSVGSINWDLWKSELLKWSFSCMGPCKIQLQWQLGLLSGWSL